MNRVIRDFWRSPATWSVIGLLFLALVCIIWALLSFQRRDYQRTSDASLAHAIEEIRSEVRSLKDADVKSIRERELIKEEVQAVKEAVER